MTKGKCKICDDIIISTGHRHNFVSCKCGKSFVDGGDSYNRFGGDILIYNNVLDIWEDPFKLEEE